MTAPSTESELHPTLEWKGPFTWSYAAPDGLFSQECVKESGIYLMTAPWNHGFVVWSAGITSRPFAQRFWEHTKEFMSGAYNILDADELVQCRRVQLWHGLWYKKNRFARLDEFRVRYVELAPHIDRLLSTLRIFVAPTTLEKRLLERTEAAIMDRLEAAGPPINAIPDKGMHLRRRLREEQPIIIENKSQVTLHGIPEQLEI